MAGVVGLKGAATDDDFDEQRLVYVQDGRQRTITVNQDWPALVYALDGDGEPPQEPHERLHDRDEARTEGAGDEHSTGLVAKRARDGHHLGMKVAS